MSKSSFLVFALLSLGHLRCATPAPDDDAVEKTIALVYQGKMGMPEAEASCQCRLEVVSIGGTVFHFGLDLAQTPPVPFPFQSTVAGARISLAEYPITKLLGIRSDAHGRWQLRAIKLKGVPLRASFVYDLAGYPTTKSQVFEIGDTPLTDVAVQFPTAAYYAAAKSQIEQQLGGLIGVPYTLNNVLVTTVAKSWASMYNPLLPHGDPGVVVSMTPAITFPASLGPVYFDAQVTPDPDLTMTSVDGGVLFGNLAPGTFTVTATKAPFVYQPLTFVIQPDVPLYVASPPHATQGTNDTPPG